MAEAPVPVAGVRLGVAEAAIKKPGRADLVVLALAPAASTAALFTRNAFAAAPVQLARARLDGGTRALLINSGNANAGTGAAGLADAEACCAAVAQALGIEPTAVLPFSTGVIGARLPVARITEAIPRAVAGLREDGWDRAARAIMTTDTRPKTASATVKLGDGQRVTLTGIAKGAGMIRPDMATMLAFVATDAAIAPADLYAALVQAADASFHRISVDGDTSTNDALVLTASGAGPALAPGHPDWPAFMEALGALCRELARAIVRDGEGATKFITVAVSGAADAAEARAVGFTVAQSPLVKTACFAGDPNWGRILAAVGRAPLAALDIGGVSISLGDVAIVRGGEPVPAYAEAEAAAVMAEAEFTIAIDLGRGHANSDVWTCDLSYDYVKINAEYRS